MKDGMEAYDATKRTEPSGITTADLFALVIGSSLALAMPWQSSPTALVKFAGGAMPSSFSCLLTLDEVIRKACLALVPVLLTRRVRLPTRGRAVECLVAFCAITQVVKVLDSLPWIADSFHHEPHPSRPNVMNWVPGPPYWWWKWGAFTVGVMAVAVLFVRGTARPAWAVSVLILLAAFGFRATVPDLITHGTDRLGIAMHLSEDVLFFVHEGINRLPLYLLYGIPACAALAAARRGRHPVGNWADGIGVALATLLLFTDQAIQFWADAAAPPFVGPLIILHSVQLAVGAVVSAIVVSRLRHAHREAVQDLNLEVEGGVVAGDDRGGHGGGFRSEDGPAR